MMRKTTLALSAALVLGTASTAFAQFYAPDVGPGPFAPVPFGPAYVSPYAYGGPYAYGAYAYGPNAYGPYAYGPNGYDTWWTNRRALHQRRAVGDTNGD